MANIAKTKTDDILNELDFLACMVENMTRDFKDGKRTETPKIWKMAMRSCIDNIEKSELNIKS